MMVHLMWWMWLNFCATVVVGALPPELEKFGTTKKYNVLPKIEKEIA